MDNIIEELKTLLYQNRLTQFGKRRLIEYYEDKINSLENINSKTKEAYNDCCKCLLNSIQKNNIERKIKELEKTATGIAGTYQYAESQEHLQEKKDKVIELRNKAEILREILNEGDE